jgi:tRNA uridine 5-carboxymethylaminomethyl modification enzyme
VRANGYDDAEEGHRGLELLRRPGLSYRGLAPFFPDLAPFAFDDASVLALETRGKYEGYIQKELRDAKESAKAESLRLPEGLDYAKMDGLALEARQKLSAVAPRTIGQASRIAGVNPADVAVLLLTLRKRGWL